VLARTASAPLRALFAVVIGLLAVEMIINGIRGRV
jgi:small neutral amino acid transporter SnatA (MarC family)